MRKIFAVSLLAILAVLPAHAEVASKGYVDEKVSGSINALDKTSTLAAGNYVTGTSETNGVVTITQSAMDTTPKSGSTAPVTSGGVYTELGKKQDKLGYTAENTANKVISIAAASSASDTKYPSEKAVRTQLDTKQNTLTAGSNITISNGTISAKDTTYNAATSTTLGLVKTGSNITNSSGTISVPLADGTATAGVVKAGNNITIEDGVISTHAPVVPGAGVLTVQKNGTAVGTFSANATSAATANIPVGNAKLTIQRNGTTVGTFTADATENATINITDNNTTYSTGTTSTSGLTKLYTATGTATDGTLTQKAITDALGGKISTSVIADEDTVGDVTDKDAVLPTLAVVEKIADTTAGDYVASKQDKLTAGSNITISGNTISAKDTTYSAATGSALGLVKTGTNIGNTNGTISVATANGSTLGLVKGGTDISISSGAMTVNRAALALKVPTKSGSTETGSAEIWVE